MVYSHSLADRVRQAIGNRRAVSEKRMFGGLAFLLQGNMLVGIWESSLVARIGPAQAAAALQQEFVAQFEVNSRPMKGWVEIEPDGLDTDRQLADWIGKALQFVETLPAK